jgi:hypothetical protein
MIDPRTVMRIVRFPLGCSVAVMVKLLWCGGAGGPLLMSQIYDADQQLTRGCAKIFHGLTDGGA